MKITLFPTYCFSESGQRPNNEDSIFPLQEDAPQDSETKLFIVCDGVGGAEKGEEASRIVCETFAEYLRNKKTVSKQDLSEALREAEGAIDDYTEAYPNAKGMATTIALLAVHQEGSAIAHVGDSRVYQIRNGKIIFKTIDHSFVNELVAQQLITEEEALNHPKKNIVTRAIVGRDTPQEIDVVTLYAQSDDYFFLCSDGVLEAINDQKLIEILREKTVADSEKMETIKSICRQHSRDNFSAHLIRISRVEKVSTAEQQLKKQVHKKNDSQSNNMILYGLILLIIVVSIINLYMIAGKN